MATTTRPRATEEDLLRVPEDGQKYELVDGEIRVSPAGYLHGLVCTRLTIRLGTFVQERGLGDLLDSSTGFRLPNGNVRLPDVCFVAKGRVSARERGFASLAPDLAVEVLSPSDNLRQVLDKVGEYLQAGTHLVWVIDPERRSAAVYRSSTKVHELSADDFLDGEDVVPGFRCRVADLID
jgi:Uma2 family endonuclease